MNYYSIEELSKLWKLTPRRIQQLCNQGKIDGAIKVGDIWFVPKMSERPTRSTKLSEIFPYISILDYVLKNQPLDIDAAVQLLPNQEKEIALCELAFVRGDFGKMKTLFYRNDFKSLGKYKFCVLYVSVFDCLATGDIEQIIDLHKIINELLKKYAGNEKIEILLKLTLSAFNIFCGFKSFEIDISNVPDLPIETKKKILMCNAYHYYLTKDLSRCEELLKTYICLIETANPLTFSDFYAYCILGGILFAKGDKIKALQLYKIASKTILREKFTQPFIDNYLIFGNYVFECIKDQGKEFVEKIETMCSMFLDHSLQVMFRMKKIDVIPLSLREARIAMLILKDLRNKEIAEQLNRSLRSVKASIEIIYQKLLIGSRSDLKKLILHFNYFN